MKSNKAIGIAAGVAAVATGLYVLYQKIAKESEVDLEEINENTVLLTEENREALHEKIKVEFEDGFITVNVIAKILGGSLVYGAPHHKRLVVQSRRERRREDIDLAQYIEICEDYIENVQKLLEKLQDEIVTEIGITTEQWDESNNHYLEQGRQDLMSLHGSLPHRFRMSLKPNRELSQEEFKKIAERQIELFEQEAKKAEEYKNLMRNTKRIYYIVQSRVDDVLVREFGVEEEDNYAALKKYNAEPEIKELFVQLRQVTSKIEAGGH